MFSPLTTPLYKTRYIPFKSFNKAETEKSTGTPSQIPELSSTEKGAKPQGEATWGQIAVSHQKTLFWCEVCLIEQKRRSVTT